MKLTTLAIAFGPPALVLAAKFAIEPAWLQDFSLAACVGLGGVIGVFGAVAARIVDPGD
jgi:hypothetical protein